MIVVEIIWLSAPIRRIRGWQASIRHYGYQRAFKCHFPVLYHPSMLFRIRYLRMLPHFMDPEFGLRNCCERVGE